MNQWTQYKVRVGDTLERIATQFYGDASRVAEIARANGLQPPYFISIGQALTIPWDGTVAVPAQDVPSEPDEIVVTARRDYTYLWLALMAGAVLWILNRR